MTTTVTVSLLTTIPLPSELYGALIAVPYSSLVIIGGEPTLTAPTDKNIISVYDISTMTFNTMESLDVAGANPKNCYKNASDASNDGFILAAMDNSYPYLISSSSIVATTVTHQTDFIVLDIAYRNASNYFFFGKVGYSGTTPATGFAIYRFDKSTQTRVKYSSFTGKDTAFVNASEFDDFGYILGQNSGSLNVLFRFSMINTGSSVDELSLPGTLGTGLLSSYKGFRVGLDRINFILARGDKLSSIVDSTSGLILQTSAFMGLPINVVRMIPKVEYVVVAYSYNFKILNSFDFTVTLTFTLSALIYSVHIDKSAKSIFVSTN